MKITTRVILGFALMILVALATHLYQAQLVRRLQAADRELAQTGFTTVLSVLRLRSSARELEEFTEKFIALRDMNYREGMLQIQAGMAREMTVLSGVETQSDPDLESAIDRLAAAWKELEHRLEQAAAGTLSEQQGSRLDAAFHEYFQSLEQVTATGDRFLARAAEQSQLTRDTVTRVSLAALVASLLLAAAISILVYQSISRSLREVIQATRRIASGDFETRIRLRTSDEIAEVGAVLNQMTRRLGELDRLKKDFVSSVSHDLRAPLASIEETTRLLLEDGGETLTGRQQRLLELTLASCRRLSRMIGDLLDLSRLEAGVMQYDLQAVNPEEAVREAVESLHGLSLEKRLKVRVSFPGRGLRILADRVRFVQVLGNLLANAYEFSPAGGTVEVAVRPVDRLPEGRSVTVKPGVPNGNGICLITVSDQGPGIPDEEKTRVFEHFYRSRTQPRKRAGTGLGLAIASRIVADHGGVIWVEDREQGQGSRFCAWFRCA